MTNSNDVYVTQEDLTEAIGKIPQPDLSNYATQQQLDTRVQDNKDGTITVNRTSYNMENSGLAPIAMVSSGSFNDLPLGTVFVDGTRVKDGPDNVHSFTTTTFYFDQWGGRKVQIAIMDSTNAMFFRVDNAGSWHDWTLVADDSKVVHTADMRKPASDVAGIEEVNAKQDKLDYTPANAANVVDRNPNTGVVSEPTDFTKLTVNGGKTVATTDDLNNYYHANASDDAALAAAKAATVPGIFWFEED